MDINKSHYRTLIVAGIIKQCNSWRDGQVDVINEVVLLLLIVGMLSHCALSVEEEKFLCPK